jgi:hypothetical protein
LVCALDRHPDGTPTGRTVACIKLSGMPTLTYHRIESNRIAARWQYKNTGLVTALARGGPRPSPLRSTSGSALWHLVLERRPESQSRESPFGSVTVYCQWILRGTILARLVTKAKKRFSLLTLRFRTPLVQDSFTLSDGRCDKYTRARAETHTTSLLVLTCAMHRSPAAVTPGRHLTDFSLQRCLRHPLAPSLHAPPGHRAPVLA